MPDDLRFVREPFARAWPLIRPLVAQHGAEVAEPDEDPPVIDVPVYTAACERGMLVTCSAYHRAAPDGAGDIADGTAEGPEFLVGYAVFWLNKMPQHVGQNGAWQDAVYLMPEVRRGSNGSRFLAYCERELVALGVQWIHHSVRPGRDFSPVLRRLGYRPVETLFAKRVA